MSLELSFRVNSSESKSVQKLSGRAVDSFAQVANKLGQVRELHSGLIEDLSQFTELFAGDGAKDSSLSDLLEKCEEISAAIEEYQKSLKSRETRALMGYIRNDLHRICAQGRFLGAVSALARTVPVSGTQNSFNQFLVDLQDTSLQFCSVSLAVEEYLDRMDARIPVVLRTCQIAKSALLDLLVKISTGVRAVDALSESERDCRVELTENTQRLAKQGGDNIGVFVVAMQYSDRMDQRLQHIAEILRHETSTARRVAASQIDDCCTEMTRVSSDVSETMDNMSVLGLDAAEFFASSATDSNVVANIEARCELTQNISEETDELGSLLKGVLEEGAEIEAISREAIGRFEVITNFSKKLSNASLNSLIMASRAGEEGASLGYLATEVRDVVQECQQSVRLCREHLVALGEANAATREQLVDAGQSLSDAADLQQGIREASEQRVASIASFRQSARQRSHNLHVVASAVRNRANDIQDVARKLTTVVLPEFRQSVAVPDQLETDQIWALYTMEEEREVHRRVYPRACPAKVESPEAAEVEEEMDDIFF